MEFTGEDIQNVDYKNIKEIWGKVLPTFLYKTRKSDRWENWPLVVGVSK